MKNTLRWIALIPGILATILIVNLITNIMLKFWGGGDGDVLTFIHNINSHEVERPLSFYIFDYFGQPALIVGFAVFVSRYIAPYGKNVIGWIFAALFILFSFGAFFVPNIISGVPMWAYVAAVIVGSVSGAAAPLEES